MRYLVLTAAVAFAAACGDTTSPTTSSIIAEDAAAHGRTDLRRARESLITAGNEVSAAIGEDGVAAGLGDALAANVILLSPRTPAISGRSEAAAFLSNDPHRAQCVELGGHLRRCLGRRPAGLHLGPWQRHLRLRHRPHDAAELLPDLLAPDRERGLEHRGLRREPRRAAAAPAARRFRHARPRRDVAPSPTPSESELLATDAAFSALSVDGRQRSRLRALRRPQRDRGRRDAHLRTGRHRRRPSPAVPNDVVSWVPRFVDVAGSGDLGFTVGDATFELAGIPPSTPSTSRSGGGMNDGQWRFVADLGNSRPAPRALSR